VTRRLCVLLWAREDRDEDLRRYEDTVLALLTDHDGVLIARGSVESRIAGDPTEVQIIEFAGQAGMDAYMADPRRTALHAERDAVIAATQILRLGT
jgi:uncharacterized protein (DUF1330 family)